MQAQEMLDIVTNEILRCWETWGDRPAAIYVSQPLYDELERESMRLTHYVPALDDVERKIREAQCKSHATICGVPIHAYESDAMEFSIVKEVSKIA